MSNVHMIGAVRKAGRRRSRPLPDVPRAKVLHLVATRRSVIHMEVCGDDFDKTPYRIQPEHALALAHWSVALSHYLFEVHAKYEDTRANGAGVDHG